MRQCSKPSCSGAAAALLGYSYGERAAVLEDSPAAESEISPHLYALCSRCADAFSPPRGWTIEDRRSRPPLFLPLPQPVEEAAEQRLLA